MLNFKYYYYSIILSLIIEKYNVLGFEKLPKIESIKIICNFNKINILENLNILRFMEFLEILINQQSSLIDAKNLYHNRKKIASCTVFAQLRKKNLYNLLNYIVQTNMPNKLNGYSKLIYKINSKGHILLYFKEIDFFKNIPERFSTLRFNMSIEICFVYSTKIISKYILHKIKL